MLYIDEASRCSTLAAGLSRADALELARAEARERRSARLFLHGSDGVPRHNAVVIIRSGPDRSRDGDREKPLAD